MRDADLEARRIAADAVLADFNRTLRERWGHPIDWQDAALRLAQHLQQLLQGLDTKGGDQLAQIRLVLEVVDWQDAGLFQDALEQIDDIVRGEQKRGAR
jgi:hypothetical protein